MRRDFLTFAILLVVLSVGLVASRNTPYFENSSDSIRHEVGDPFMYSSDHVLDTFEIEDITMNAVLHLQFHHDLNTRETLVHFYIGLFPEEPYEIYHFEGVDPDFELNSSYVEFYGSLNHFSLLINGQQRDPLAIKNGSIYHLGTSVSGEPHQNYFYNIIRYDYEYQYTVPEYIYHEFDLELSFSIDVMSNHTKFSPDGSEILLATTPVVGYQYSVATLNKTISQTLPWLFVLPILILVSKILLRYKTTMSEKEITDANDLRLLTSILPHLIAPLLGLLYIRGYTIQEGLIIYASYFVVSSVIPIGIELGLRDYRYRGMQTIDWNRSENLSVLPFTMKVEETPVNRNKSEDRLLKLYGRRLFPAIRRWTLYDLFILMFLMWQGNIFFLRFVLVYYVIVFIRKVKV